jgi:hypothetical protein
MASFQIGDDASTFDEMRDKIDRRAAAAEARMQLGSTSVDNQMQEIERKAMDYAAPGQAAAIQERDGTASGRQRCPCAAGLAGAGRDVVRDRSSSEFRLQAAAA